jgi:hypothetical protein
MCLLLLDVIIGHLLVRYKDILALVNTVKPLYSRSQLNPAPYQNLTFLLPYSLLN